MASLYFYLPDRALLVSSYWGRTEVIESRPSMFGQARVFGTMAGGPTGDFRIGIVPTWKDAAEYLGMDLSEAQTELRRRREEGDTGNAG